MTMEPTRDQLRALLRQVAATAPEEIDCEALLDRLAAYVDLVRAQGPEASIPPELACVRQHLEVCPECCEELVALLRVLASE